MNDLESAFSIIKQIILFGIIRLYVNFNNTNDDAGTSPGVKHLTVLKPETLSMIFAPTGSLFHAAIVKGKNEFICRDVCVRRLEILGEFSK